jgi:D-alanyl-D-alanine carboxypeptidase/D-alanyl-D-alanine-endopeptidase (penicillin-binding protein 4)
MPKPKNNRYLLLALMVLLVCVLSVRLSGGQKEKADAKKQAPPSPAKSVKPETPSRPNDNQVGDKDLSAKIDQAIDDSEVREARWGVLVTALKNGHILYSRNADRPFMPASNMKIYTTAVALDTLGGEYRWRTSVYADIKPGTEGIINGDLTLYGRGSPDLISKPKGDAPSLVALADKLYQNGVRQVRGNIVGDASYFRGELFGVGWQWNDLQWYFGAEPSALSIDENSVEVTIAPGKQGGAASVTVTPNENVVHVINNTTTGERDATTTIGIMRDLSGNDLRVWGDFPTGGSSFSAFVSVHDPALWAATKFRQALIARGIKVDGEARSRDFRFAEKDRFDPQKASELSSVDSEPLEKIVHTTNKESNNLFAELLLRTIGKERGSSAPDPDPRKNRGRGDDAAGTAVVMSWLQNRGILTRGVAIHDGSGLSRLDLVTPETTAGLLAAMAGNPAATAFHDSLPIAGHDGTLAGRLKPVTGRISAKTGSLTYTHSLSGYAVTSTGEVLVFSIMCNDATADRSAVRVIDEVAALIANFRPSNPPR